MALSRGMPVTDLGASVNPLQQAAEGIRMKPHHRVPGALVKDAIDDVKHWGSDGANCDRPAFHVKGAWFKCNVRP